MKGHSVTRKYFQKYFFPVKVLSTFNYVSELLSLGLKIFGFFRLRWLQGTNVTV